MARQIERGGNGGRLGAQKENVAGLLCQVGAGTHGDAGVSLGKRGGVVDAVAHHGYAQAALLESANARQLAGGVETCLDLGDSSLFGDGRGGESGVACQHQDAEPGLAQGGNSLSRIGAQCVAGIEIACGDVVQSHP